MTNDEQQKRIDDYLLGRSDADARREMDEEISRNAELSAAVGDTELALAAIELAEDQALKARLQNLESRLRGEAAPVAAESTAVVRPLATPGTKKAGVQPRRNLRRLYAIAAAVLVLLLAGWFVLQPRGYDSPETLAAATFKPYRNITTGNVRGGENDTERAAYDAYDAGDYPTAVSLFEQLPETDTHQFYYGQSLLGNENFAAAARRFDRLRNRDFGLAEESAYYLALARLGQRKTADARQLLETISATSGHAMQQPAAALLAEVNDLP